MTLKIGEYTTTNYYANGTSITHSYPWGLYISAHVLCGDGIVRKTKRIAQTADTFFSVPASVVVKGKTIAGYITVETREGYSTTTDNDPAIVKFVAYTYRCNAQAIGDKSNGLDPT